MNAEANKRGGGLSPQYGVLHVFCGTKLLFVYPTFHAPPTLYTVSPHPHPKSALIRETSILNMEHDDGDNNLSK